MAWNCSFRSTFRLISPHPAHGRSDVVDAFLQRDGCTKEEVLGALPYHQNRSRSPDGIPSWKRYRDGRQLLRTVGLVYEEEVDNQHRIRVTELGHAVRRWRADMNDRNAPVLGSHAARSLAACQLRNASPEARHYDQSVRVFPFAFIWRAMLALDGTITSDELNRAILKTENKDDLNEAIERIRVARLSDNLELLGDEVVSGTAKNDRILVWMAWASFGWTLINDKRTSGCRAYRIAPRATQIVRDAARLTYPHREFATESDYVQYVSRCANLPADLR